MAYYLAAINEDYSWLYGELPHHKFIDNFNIGYNLFALKNWIDFTGERNWEKELKNAYRHFLNTF